MQNIPRATVKQLAYKIKDSGKHPRFAFFLGAGASRDSGIVTTPEMIRIFKERIIAESGLDTAKTDLEKETWLSAQDWYQKKGTEYSKLFEQCEPKEIGRQRFIESIIEGHEPSFGYVVLANLIASGYINTVVTTNFDDLIYSACTSYTGIRPIVYAYGVLASEMRLTAQRPRILKLHGDYLYSALKNTSPELSAQDPNMARQAMQILSEYGLVVVGYGGGDESVRRILSNISEKNDFYWCIKRGDEPGEEVQTLVRSKGGFIVEIDGFDQMMDEIRHVVGFDVGKMFESIQDRQDHMIEKLRSFTSEGYSVDILTELWKALDRQRDVRQEKRDKIYQLDLFLQALKAHETGDLKKAEGLYRKIIKLDQNDVLAYYNLGTILDEDVSRFNEAEEAYRKAIELEPQSTDAYYNLLLLLRFRKRLEEALTVAKDLLRIKPQDVDALLALAAINRKLRHVGESKRYAALAREFIKPDDWYYLAGLESICNNLNAALENLGKAVRSGMVDPQWAMRDPDLERVRARRRVSFTEVLKSGKNGRPRKARTKKKPVRGWRAARKMKVR